MKPKRKEIVPAERSWISTAQLHWQPHSLPCAAIDHQLMQMDALQRTTEVLRYNVRKLEFWLSPGGNLREWLRFNVAIAIFISLPALLIVPVVTYLLGQFATWSALLVQIASNLLVFPITGIIGIALLSAAILLLQLIFRR